MGTESDEVGEDEILVRRVPSKDDYFDARLLAEAPLGPTHLAFRPSARDVDGLSLSRLKCDAHPDFHVLEQYIPATSKDDKPRYLALMRASVLLNAGLVLKPDRQPDDPGHVLVTSLRSDNRRTDAVTAFALTMAREWCFRVVGPFTRDGPVPAGFVDRSR